jgi:hypothetical protein
MTRDGKTLAFVARMPTGDAITTMALTNLSLKELVESNDNRVYFSNLVFAPRWKDVVLREAGKLAGDIDYQRF